MKLRHPGMIRAAAIAGAGVLRLWIGTLRYRYHPRGPNLDPTRPDCPGRFIYAFWHENMLLPAYHYGAAGVHVLISRHADGQLITEVVERLGFHAVRGSTTRGGAEAMMQMHRLAERSHLAITPDGPRGPRRRVQPGLIYLAARTGLPIVPVGIGYDRPWRARSWDRFAVPRPFARAVCVTEEPIRLPADLPRDDLEPYRLRVEEALHRITEEAERLAGPAEGRPSEVVVAGGR
jgi:hypothetical protein